MKIIIDPGHGGKDSGGGNNQYWKEKDMSLKISLLQYKRFIHLGVPVSLTRDTDVYLNKDDRTSKVRSSGADICISNHINYFSDPEVEGAEVIHSIFNDGKLANMIMEELVAEGAKKRRVFSKESQHYPGQDWYYMHRLTGKIQTLIVEYGFANNTNDTQKILLHWHDYAEAVVKATCRFINHSYNPPITEEGTKFISEMKVTVEQMKQWAKNNNATQRFIDVAEIYAYYSAQTGIRGDILYCQSAKETSFGKYPGAVQPEMNNFAGIKIKNPTGDKTSDHETFETVNDGVRGHFNHISAYIGLEPIGKPHDRYYLVNSLSWAGTVKYIEELGGKWSANPNYGRSILNLYLEPLLNTKVDTIDYKTLYEQCKKENKTLSEEVMKLRDKLKRIEDILKD